MLDADGLFAFSPFVAEFRRSASFVLTPHPGEFARLTGEAAPTTDNARREQAVSFARKFGCVLLLKGSGTVVTDGTKFYRNTTGNPGMATGGSGDVLSGVIAALMGQGFSARSTPRYWVPGLTVVPVISARGSWAKRHSRQRT